MRGFFNGLVIGLILGVAGYWYADKKAKEHPVQEQRAESAGADARASASDTAHHLSDALRAKLDTLDLRGDQVKDELARTGKIVRRKAEDIGDQVSDAAANARIVASIKAKFAGDHDLSVWQISVSCDQGHVSLTGTVSDEDDIGKAVALALDTDGVRDVTATLSVKPKS